MAKVDKLTAKRVMKDIDPGATERNGSNRRFLPGDAIDMLNCRTVDASGRSEITKNTPGNTLKNYNLPAGTNIVLGSIVFEKEDTIIYFVYNSNGDHRVVEWDKTTDLFTLLLSGSSLGFDADYLIRGYTIDDLCIYNDRLARPREFNIVRARAGEYVAPYSEFLISLAKKPPLDPPTVALVDDTDALISQISDDTWQFTHRYIYKDNEPSTFGPLSKLIWPGINVDPVTTTERAIEVTVPLALELASAVKKIEFAYRRGNNGDYTVFETVIDPGVGPHTVKFRNNENQFVVSEAEETAIYDTLADRTEALALIDSRVFAVDNEVGFAENDPAATLTLALDSSRVDEHPGKRFLKEGGVYGASVLYVDEFGKTSFAESAKKISVPFEFLNETVAVDNPRGGSYNTTYAIRKTLDWTLAGTPPPYAKKYQILLSRDRYYANYFQCKTKPHLYVRDVREGEVDGQQSEFAYFWKGRVFEKLVPQDVSETTATLLTQRGWKYVFLQVPLNIPFIPDTSCFVRFTSTAWPEGCKRIVPILDVIGDFIVIDLKYTRDDLLDRRQLEDFKFDWSVFNETSIEVFQLNDTQDPRFYEVSEVYDVVGGNFSVVSGKLFGDTYNFHEATVQHVFDEVLIEGSDYLEGSSEDSGMIDDFESPTGIVGVTAVEKAHPLRDYKRTSRSTTIPGQTPSGGSEIVEQTTIFASIKTLDYFKAASDFGRAHVELKGAKRNNYANSVSFSNPYIQNTQVNGLSTFQASNNYPIAVERSPIRALLPANNVLLAVHERHTTSMYIGEGILNEGQDFILVKVEKVIGDDRPLDKAYGTINPESVIFANGQGFWWDGLRGCVVRYTKAGLFPISWYGVYSYFKAKGRIYYPYRDQIKVVTGYDYATDEFIITFPAVQGVIEAETWAFNVKEEFWHRYSFIGEDYNAIGDDLISFKSGKLYVHNGNSVHNNFYGVQYTRKYKVVCNVDLGKNKKFLNIHLNGHFAADPESDTFIPVRLYTPEGQESYIPAYEFDRDTLNQGMWNGSVLRDINTPGVEATKLALRSGDELVSNYLIVEVENNRTDEAPSSHVNVIYIDEEFSV